MRPANQSQRNVLKCGLVAGPLFLLVCGYAALAWAQTAPVPSPPVATGQATAAPMASEESKQTIGNVVERDNNRERARAGRGVRDPGAKAPMDIRLLDGGVKMPKCAEESREGETCK